MERTASKLQHRAKKMMYAEYETTEPRLRRVLGHCAVYHFASYIIETEELIAAQLEERYEDQGWSSSSSEDEDEHELESLHKCHSPVIETCQDTKLKLAHSESEIIDIDCEIKVVSSDIGTITLCEAEYEEIASVKNIRRITRPKQTTLPNPLRSHPPPSPTSAKEHPNLSPASEDHTNKMILRMARALHKVLIKVHPKSSWMEALEEGDIEAQRWLEKAIFGSSSKQDFSLNCSGGTSHRAWTRQSIK